jgi:AraC family transcriptional activator of pobA
MDIKHIDSLTDHQSAGLKADHYHLNGEPVTIGYSRRDFYKIWLVCENGKIIVSGKEIRFDSPALIFLHPLLPYTFIADDKDTSGFWVIFTESFKKTYSVEDNLLRSRLFNAEQPSVFFLDKKELEVIHFLFSQLVLEYQGVPRTKYFIIQNYINLLICKGLEMNPFLIHAEKSNAASRMAAQFLDLLERQYPITSPKEPLALRKPKDFANVLAVHVNHLNAVVREITHKPTRDHIYERIITESKVLLLFSNWTIADIAYSLGFNYPNHFNNFFKKYTGTTPLSLRNNSLNFVL